MTCSGLTRHSATVFKVDPLDPVRGKLYRDKILLYGGSRDEMDSLKVNMLNIAVSLELTCFLQDFLGRSPDNVAFLKELFGDVPTSNL